MADETATVRPRRAETFPERLFIILVAAVCVGLAGSAAYGFLTLQGLREEFLRNRGNDIAIELDRYMRGPGMRGNPSYWQGEFDDALPGYRDRIAFLALVDDSNTVLAGAGDRPESAYKSGSGFVTTEGSDLYIFEWPLSSGRGEHMGKGAAFSGRRLRIGLYASAADFIRRQAELQLAVSGLAILTLIGLAYYFTRTLHRFFELQAREESARHLAALGSMAATLAHEIRNPLGAMKGLTQLAQEDLPRDHIAQQFMKTVVGEAERLEQLVTDLLTFARPRPPSVGDFDFIGLLNEVRTQLCSRPECAGRMVEIHTASGTMPVSSDPNGLRQILLNILLNALEATPEGGSVSVRAMCDQSAGVLKVEIEDGGPGLGDRDPEELFEPFVTTKTRGTGLGLSVSRQIANALGGSLMLKNRPQGGAVCVLEVPCRPGAGLPEDHEKHDSDRR